MVWFCAFTCGEDSQTLSLYCHVDKIVYLSLEFRPGPPVARTASLHSFTSSLLLRFHSSSNHYQDHSPSSLLPPNLTGAIGNKLFFTLPHFIKFWFPKFQYVSLSGCFHLFDVYKSCCKEYRCVCIFLTSGCVASKQILRNGISANNILVQQYSHLNVCLIVMLNCTIKSLVTTNLS